ncbi:hypothetical protein IQ07DRAFT_643272 [Pyrenochaeta sp. DS3sAY3a]|nr:hypothetical protein IQ07DRAFT_643272 [Pyrenochaeta sp. DS3sAY3a]
MTTALPIIPPRQPVRRPKLSINTHQPRILGKGASLRLETLSAVSPTVRNTFSNAYEHASPATPSLPRPSKPRLSIDSNLPNPPSASTPNSASTLSSTLTSASHESATIAIPYKQPHNLASILTNSPAKSIIPRKMAPSRPMFPAEKRVSFRTPIEEEITTVKYTLAHSDIESSTSTLSSLASLASSDAAAASTDSDPSAERHSLSPIDSTRTTSEPARLPLEPPLQRPSATTAALDISPPRSKSPRVGEKRDSSSSEDDSDCPETPVAGRRKRRRDRDWRWTLGPLTESDKSASSTSDATTSDDSN